MDTRRVGIPKSVAGRINAMISKGDLPPGAKLPSQRQLSTRFGVSRTSIREAISHLEASGTLRTEPGRGTFVVPSSNGSIAHRLVDEGRATSYARLDLCQFRHMLEGQSARLAAMRVTDDDLAALEKNLRRFRDQTRAHELHEASAGVEFVGLASPSRGAVETAVWRLCLAPGAKPLIHQLTREEVFVAISGTAQATLAGEAIEVSAGSALVVPANTDFSLSNSGLEPFEAVAVFPVGGMARMGNEAPFTPPWAA